VIDNKERTHHHQFALRCCSHLSVIDPSSFLEILALGRVSHVSLSLIRVPRSLLKVGFILLRVWAVLDEMSKLPTVEATTRGTGKGRDTSTRGTRLIGRKRLVVGRIKTGYLNGYEGRRGKE
jgi:hypothetical protein